MADIKVYGAPWCPDCKRSKKFLAEHRVAFDWLDIDQDGAARTVSAKDGLHAGADAWQSIQSAPIGSGTHGSEDRGGGADHAISIARAR